MTVIIIENLRLMENGILICEKCSSIVSPDGLEIEVSTRPNHRGVKLTCWNCGRGGIGFTFDVDHRTLDNEANQGILETLRHFVV